MIILMISDEDLQIEELIIERNNFEKEVLILRQENKALRLIIKELNDDKRRNRGVSKKD